jgi:hypothetical protein
VIQEDLVFMHAANFFGIGFTSNPMGSLLGGSAVKANLVSMEMSIQTFAVF